MMMARQLEDFNPNLYHSTEDYQCIIVFNEETFVDKTNWTIRSNFIAFLVLLASAIKLTYFPHQRKARQGNWNRQQMVERLAPLFLFMEAMSHGFSGLFHWTVTNGTSQNLWESVAQMFGIFASVVFFLLAIMVVLSCQHSLSRCVQVLWRVGISGLWLAIIYAYMFDGSSMLEGTSLHMYILMGIAMLLLLAYGIRIVHTTLQETNGHFFVKSLALLAIIIATAYSYNVYMKCGSYSGYLECFIRCPLPGGLNHTSFYNLAKVLALVIWAMAEDFHPSVSLYQLNLGLREDDATVISDGVDDDDSVDELMDKDEEQNESNQSNMVEVEGQQQGQNVVESIDDLEAIGDIELQPSKDTAMIAIGTEVDDAVSSPSDSKKTDIDRGEGRVEEAR